MKRIAFILLFITLAAVITVYTVTVRHVDNDLPIKESQFYTVSKGSSFNSVVANLIKQQWLETSLWLKLYSKLHPEITEIKAGTYKLPEQLTIKQLFAILVAGEEHQFKITFVEGSTFKEWFIQLAETEHVQSTLADKSYQQILSTLESEHKHPEGLFFPDTYQFISGTKDIDILKQAYQRMAAELDESWQGRAKNLPYKNTYEVLIMASMVEKETAKISEQPLISAVFITRLAKRMRLQTDPTIIYGLGERYTGDITYANLREKTAYNTYRINGMPPTPIAMPGKSAIEASLHPANSPFLYFVSKGNGEHHFSTTLAEHNNAVNKYIRGKK
ncbi:endolytic transglycosylase MltG [Thalassotalea psychrophila]|uniref:Endolytic murein transglycosylase n=1 Tax=Thalassotalea psychrophila TaxID=3065647 RepID=A0ABY9TPU3_9GAMM|nr:endolytic transglycosylase MltG [Colwelliaceae bacterium SQ149]